MRLTRVRLGGPAAPVKEAVMVLSESTPRAVMSAVVVRPGEIWTSECTLSRMYSAEGIESLMHRKGKG
jgi:hypothetical protein